MLLWDGAPASVADSQFISNTAATAIAGTFSNLADNSMLAVGSNTYLVSYEGGDGKDLTLTVQ